MILGFINTQSRSGERDVPARQVVRAGTRSPPVFFRPELRKNSEICSATLLSLEPCKNKHGQVDRSMQGGVDRFRKSILCPKALFALQPIQARSAHSPTKAVAH